MDWATLQIVIVLVLVVVVFFGFIRERLPADIVALSAVAVLLATGILSAKDALSVFSNSAPITVAAMFVLSAALERTGQPELQQHPLDAIRRFVHVLQHEDGSIVVRLERCAVQRAEEREECARRRGVLNHPVPRVRQADHLPQPADHHFLELGECRARLPCEAEHPEAGEVIFTDEADAVSARRWCWRQSRASAAGEDTSEILVTVEGHHDGAAADVDGALRDLEALLGSFAGAASMCGEVLDASRLEFTPGGTL